MSDLYSLSEYFGVESASFNNTSKLGPRIEAELEHLFSVGVTKTKDLKNLEQIINKEVGCNVELELVNMRGNMGVFLPSLSTDHPLETNNRWIEDVNKTKGPDDAILAQDAKHLLAKNKVVDLQVDIETVKISGKIAKVKVPFRVGKSWFDQNELSDIQTKTGLAVTPKRLTAIFLHEIGHVFTYFYHLKDMVTSNYIMENMIAYFKGVTSTKDRYEYARTARDLGYPVPDTKDIVYADDESLRVLIFKEQTLEYKSRLNGNIYEYRSCEALADNFAVRLGYGRAIAEVDFILEKFYGTDLNGDKRYFLRILINALSIFPPIGALLIFTSFMTEDMTYDSLLRRPKVIRQEMTSAVTRKKLSKAELKQLLKDIDEIEKLWDVIPSTKMKNVATILNKLWYYKTYKNVRLQKDLESLAHNRLAEIAARLEN